MNFTLKIWRQKDAKSKGAFESYKVENISADTSFLEMLDILNNNLIHEGKEPVAFDHDCREGICGMCSLHIDGQAHGRGRVQPIQEHRLLHAFQRGRRVQDSRARSGGEL